MYFSGILIVVALVIWIAWRGHAQNVRSRKIYAEARALKSVARPGGRFHQSPYSSQQDFLVYMGQFLKHKKHEWVFVAFARNRKAVCFWSNKGADCASVAIGLSAESIAMTCQRQGCDSIWIGHNHPAGALAPSRQDRISLESQMDCLSQYGISIEEYVFVAGSWTRYELSVWQRLRRFFTWRRPF